MQSNKTIVIGAGPAGLGYAFNNNNCIVLEQKKNAGGLSNSFDLSGGTLDYGGHSFHTPHPEVRNIFEDKCSIEYQERKAFVFHGGSIIKYPFQQNFTELKDLELVKKIKLLNKEKVKTTYNKGTLGYEIQNKFQKGIIEEFLFPYNFKLWGTIDEISSNWVKERIAGSDKKITEFLNKGGSRTPLVNKSKVGYPKKGGFGNIFESIGKECKNIFYGTEIRKIDNAKKLIYTNHDTYQYDKLINTLPINLFIKKLYKCDDEISNIVSKLEALSINLVNITVDHPPLNNIQRIYNSEDKYLPHKTVINHNSSDYLRNKQLSSIQGEISSIEDLNITEDAIYDNFIELCIQTGLIKSRESIIDKRVIMIKNGYPKQTLFKLNNFDKVMKYFENNRIYNIGRFAQWDYINSDEAFHRGLSLNDKIQ